MTKLNLVTTCVTVPPEDLPVLELAVENERPVTFQTFARYVDVKSVSESLGYQQGRARKGERLLKLGNDWAVSFYRSVWKGKRCYIMRWSAIEHVYQ